MQGLTYGNDGNFYVVNDEKQIYKISPDGKTITLVAGGDDRACEDGLISEAKFRKPWGIAVASDGTIYIADKSKDEWHFVGVPDGWADMSYYCIRKIYFDNN